jgi:hypothetical protein
MKDRFFDWLAQQLVPTLRIYLEPLIRAEAAKIVAELQAELQREAAQPRPARRFIGRQ